MSDEQIELVQTHILNWNESTTEEELRKAHRDFSRRYAHVFNDPAQSTKVEDVSLVTRVNAAFTAVMANFTAAKNRTRPRVTQSHQQVVGAVLGIVVVGGILARALVYSTGKVLGYLFPDPPAPPPEP